MTPGKSCPLRNFGASVSVPFNMGYRAGGVGEWGVAKGEAPSFDLGGRIGLGDSCGMFFCAKEPVSDARRASNEEKYKVSQ